MLSPNIGDIFFSTRNVLKYFACYANFCVFVSASYFKKLFSHKFSIMKWVLVNFGARYTLEVKFGLKKKSKVSRGFNSSSTF